MIALITLEMNEQDAKTLQGLLGIVLVSSATQHSAAEFDFIKTAHTRLGEALEDIEKSRNGEQVYMVNHFTAGLK